MVILSIEPIYWIQIIKVISTIKPLPPIKIWNEYEEA